MDCKLSKFSTKGHRSKKKKAVGKAKRNQVLMSYRGKSRGGEWAWAEKDVPRLGKTLR